MTFQPVGDEPVGDEIHELFGGLDEPLATTCRIEYVRRRMHDLYRYEIADPGRQKALSALLDRLYATRDDLSSEPAAA